MMVSVKFSVCGIIFALEGDSYIPQQSFNYRIFQKKKNKKFKYKHGNGMVKTRYSWEIKKTRFKQ